MPFRTLVSFVDGIYWCRCGVIIRKLLWIDYLRSQFTVLEIHLFPIRSGKVPSIASPSGPQTCGAKPLRVSALLTAEAGITPSSRSKQS